MHHISDEERRVLEILMNEDFPLTAKDLHTSSAKLITLEKQGLVKKVGQLMSHSRGRPANLYWPTPQGRKAVRTTPSSRVLA